MKTMCVWTGLLAALLLVTPAGANLIPNGNFDQGGAGWSNTGGGGTYFYSDGPDSICSIGWWNGYGIWEDTGTVFAADTQYQMTVKARTGDGQLEGLTLSIIDVTNGWTHKADPEFWFPAEDKGSKGPWREFSFVFDTAQNSDVVGHNIGVAVACRDTADWNDYGWLHIDEVALTQIPEPASMLLLGLGAAFIRRKK